VGVKLDDDERVSPLRSGGPGVSPPEMFGHFTSKMWHFGAKLHFVFKAKCNFDKLLVTHKWFSEVA